jgi:hypothetical protein
MDDIPLKGPSTPVPGGKYRKEREVSINLKTSELILLITSLHHFHNLLNVAGPSDTMDAEDLLNLKKDIECLTKKIAEISINLEQS